MITVTQPSALKQHIGESVSSGCMVLVSNQLIDAFLDVSEDRQSIHTADAMSRIVPGNLLIALIPRLLKSCIAVTEFEKCLTVKYDNIRFKSPLNADGKVGLTIEVKSVHNRGPGTFVTVEACLIEQTEQRPVLSARITDFYEMKR